MTVDTGTNNLQVATFDNGTLSLTVSCAPGPVLGGGEPTIDLDTVTPGDLFQLWGTSWDGSNGSFDNVNSTTQGFILNGKPLWFEGAARDGTIEGPLVHLDVHAGGQPGKCTFLWMVIPST